MKENKQLIWCRLWQFHELKMYIYNDEILDIILLVWIKNTEYSLFKTKLLASLSQQFAEMPLLISP